MYRIFDPCKSGECGDCAGVIAQSSERRSADESVIEATCTHECHEAEDLALMGGEA